MHFGSALFLSFFLPTVWCPKNKKMEDAGLATVMNIWKEPVTFLQLLGIYCFHLYHISVAECLTLIVVLILLKFYMY